MSIEINLETPNKKELADLLVSISNLIKVSTNKRILVVSKVYFKKESEKNAD